MSALPPSKQPRGERLDSRTRGHAPAGHRDSEALSREALQLRGLARALIEDEATADDLVQEAYGVALQAGPSVRRLGPFLRGTVRRLAARERRSRVRRELREAQREVPEPSPAAADLAAGFELGQVAKEELRLLPPAQQRAVTLRHLDGLGIDRIATLEGVAPATIRAHIARGLESLRERMDRRLGSRSAWSVGLLPLLNRPPVHSGPQTPGGPAGGPPAVLGGLAMSSTLTLSLAALGCTVAGLLWWARPRGSVEEVAGKVSSRRKPEIAALQDLAVPRAPADEEVRQTVEFIDTQAALAAPRGRVVDSERGDPVPWLPITLRDSSGRVVELETDREGRFGAPLELAVGALALAAADFQALEEVRPALDLEAEPFPFRADLRASVGATFRLELGGALETGPMRAALEPINGLPGLTARVRGEREPWVRFPYRGGLRSLGEDFRLVVLDEAGFLRGESRVQRAIGFEPDPVRIDMNRTGVVEFSMRGGDEDFLTHYDVELVHRATQKLRRCLVRSRTLPGQAPDGRVVRHLEPGLYDWRLGPEGSSMSGSVEVIAGERHSVEIELPTVLGTFDARVSIYDPSHEVDLSQAHVWVHALEDRSNAFVSSLERDPTAGLGAWMLDLQGIPAGSWRVNLGEVRNSDHVARFVPSRLTVGPGQQPASVELEQLGAPTRVEVSVLDDVTGADVPLAQVAYWLSDGSANSPGRPLEGEPLLISLPDGVESWVHALAPGYQLARVAVRPEKDPYDVEIRLRKGWGTRVAVRGDGSGAPLSQAQVLLDGEVEGETNEEGWLWVEAPSCPREISVRAPGFATAVLRSEDDSVLGSVFGVNVFLKRE